MPTLREKTVPTREKGVGAVGAWAGTLGGLAAESERGNLETRIRTFAQDSQSDIEYALHLLSTLEGLGIVVHGPAGCSAALQLESGGQVRWSVTNLNERDSIMGGDAKLRSAILEIHKIYLPRAIAVVSTPVVAINNDDIDSVCSELRDELSIPIIPVYTDGFHAKVGSTGQDIATHSLIRHLLPVRRKEEGSHIDLLSVAESRADVESIRVLLSELGVRATTFPRFSHVFDAQRISSARLSIALDPDAGAYAGKVLKEIYGIPFVNPGAPVGIAGTERWLTTLGDALEIFPLVEDLVSREKARLSSLLRSASSFKGTRVFVNLPADPALAFLDLAQELGLSVVGIKVPWVAGHHGKRIQDLDESLKNIPLLVGDGQPFEEVNLLRQLPVDLYITLGKPPVHALLHGIPVLNLAETPILGFEGVRRLVQGIERALRNTSLSRFLSEEFSEPYFESWLKRSLNWYIKQEVR